MILRKFLHSLKIGCNVFKNLNSTNSFSGFQSTNLFYFATNKKMTSTEKRIRKNL